MVRLRYRVVLFLFVFASFVLAKKGQLRMVQFIGNDFNFMVV